MRSTLWENIVKYGVLVLCVSAVNSFLRFPLDSTTFFWIINSVIILSMFMLWDKTYHPTQIMMWMLLVSVSCLIGAFICRDYWDWKLLISNVISYSICLAAVAVAVPDLLQKVLNILYKHIWKLFILLALFLASKGIAKFLLPFSFLALFYPLLSSKYRKFVWVALFITIAFGFQSRSDIIRFFVCIAIGLWSVRHDIASYARRWYWIFFVLPFVLFVLAANGSFNIFKVGEKLDVEVDETSRINVTDSRSLLYEEVIKSVEKRGTQYFGGTPARGYYSEWLIRNMDRSDITGDLHYGERGNSESSVLNVYMHFGILGMIVYLLVFVSASYFSIFRSNNIYIPVIGLYVAFRYAMGWMEDFTNFDLNMFFLWAMIGMCYSPYFRDMSDEDFEEWFNGVLA